MNKKFSTKFDDLGVIIMRKRWSIQQGEKDKDKSAVESQKDVIIIQRHSLENQKGAIAVQSVWR